MRESWRSLPKKNDPFFFILSPGNAGRSTLLQIAAFSMLWYGSVLVIQPAITTGLLLTFFLYVGLAATGVGVLSSVWPGYTRMLGSVQRLFELANLHKYARGVFESKPSSEKGKQTEGMEINSIESAAIRNISFRYPTSPPDAFIFKDFSIDIKGGVLKFFFPPPI